jgi:16S rRNA (adenine1518-N6/adenine1519-N6)-dimethyltransferase
MSVYGLKFRKEFGQNFLTNNLVVEDIADNCCDGRSETILEIGPGIGTLTAELASRYKNVIALEIDKSLIPVLAYTLEEHKNVQVICEDVMKADLNQILAPYLAGGISVCANLPYYITTPILMKLLESEIPFDYITIMIQSEVADRLCAKPGSRDCGAITTVLSYYGMAEKLFTVSAGNFMPPPKVNSSVVRIQLYKDKPYKPTDTAIFFRTVKAAFEQRRKTLPNALSAGFPELQKDLLTELVTECGLSPDIRGEKLDTATFVTLSDKIADAIKNI